MRWLFFISVLIILILSGKSFGQNPINEFRSEEWKEANNLFHQDYRWKGADGAYSINLMNGRILWLFADTYIAHKAPFERNRQCVAMIRNSIGIQEGFDPTKSTIQFFWRNEDSLPSSFFPEKDTLWYWPLDGIRLDKKLLIFMMELHGIDKGIGFEVCNHAAIIISNPDDNPKEWQIQDIQLPVYSSNLMIGSALEIYKGYLYAFCCHEPGTHNIYLARWPIDSVQDGNLLNPEWWSGDIYGWSHILDTSNIPDILFEDGATEFSIWYDSSRSSFFQVQTVGFGQAKLVFRWAPKITGPWSEPIVIFDPPENSIPNIMIYSAKAHPHINDSVIVLTYATNGPESLIVSDTCIYFPKFVLINLWP